MNGKDAVRENLTRFTLEVHDKFSRQVVRAAREAGVQSFEIRQGRIVQLQEKRSRISIPALRTPSLIESPGEVIRFLVRPDRELEILHHIVGETRLDIPGRGTVYTEPVEVTGPGAGEWVHGGTPGAAREAPVPDGILTHLTGISFIVSKGLGNTVASAALELGTCVPVVTFGTGTGLRDKIGLLRITIPAEKEVVNLVTPEHDAEGIVALIVEELRLNQPGKGFVYGYPVGAALLNTRLRIGQQRHAATLEQIIAAIDTLRSGTEWRRRFTGDKPASFAGGQRFLRGVVGLSIICGEDWSFRLTRAAMAAGSGGATAARLRFTGTAPVPAGASPSLELTTMIVSEELVAPITDALIAEGLFEPEASGRLEISRCPFAYAYSGSKQMHR